MLQCGIEAMVLSVCMVNAEDAEGGVAAEPIVPHGFHVPPRFVLSGHCDVSPFAGFAKLPCTVYHGYEGL